MNLKDALLTYDVLPPHSETKKRINYRFLLRRVIITLVQLNEQ
jgi:hypothetical protein